MFPPRKLSLKEELRELRLPNPSHRPMWLLEIKDVTSAPGFLIGI